MAIFLTIVCCLILYSIIVFFKRYRQADMDTLMPFNSWIHVIMTKSEKDRDAMAHGLLVQSSNLLVEFGSIQSIDTVMRIFRGSNICKTNFIINVITSNTLYLKEEELSEYRSSLENPARVFFATALYTYIARNGKDVNLALFLLERISEKPFKGWN